MESRLKNGDHWSSRNSNDSKEVVVKRDATIKSVPTLDMIVKLMAVKSIMLEKISPHHLCAREAIQWRARRLKISLSNSFSK